MNRHHNAEEQRRQECGDHAEVAKELHHAVKILMQERRHERVEGGAEGAAHFTSRRFTPRKMRTL